MTVLGKKAYRTRRIYQASMSNRISVYLEIKTEHLRQALERVPAAIRAFITHDLSNPN
jgi:hypothetical protein